MEKKKSFNIWFNILLEDGILAGNDYAGKCGPDTTQEDIVNHLATNIIKCKVSQIQVIKLIIV